MKGRGKLLTSAARLVGLPGNAGLVPITTAVAAHLQIAVPERKQDRYRLLGWFIDGKTIPPKPPAVRRYHPPPVRMDAFLSSYGWRQLRMKVLVARGARCECCGATRADGVKLHVDHIKPRRKYPELSLEESNLQVLCEVCNHGKGNWDETDWRKS